MNNRLIFFINIAILLITLNWKASGQAVDSVCDNCSVAKLESLKMVNCMHHSFTCFPTDCPSDVHTLDLSNAKFSSVDPFLNIPPIQYSKLVKLFMKSMNKSIRVTPKDTSFHIPADFFGPFLSLEEIDMSYTKLNLMAGNFTWPPKLRFLHVTGCKLKELPSLGAVQTLEQLNAAGNSLKLLPKIHKKSPISRIELRDNPLDTVDVAILAPLCQLNYLGIRVSKGGTLNKPQGFCNCLRLVEWLKKAGIGGEEKLICDGGNLTQQYCEDELIFAANIIDAHAACLDEAPSTSVLELLIIAMGFAILFPIFYFGYEAYTSRAERSDKVAVKRLSKIAESPTESHQDSLIEEYEEYLESISETETYESLRSSLMNYE